jgi:hypothetical protein
VSVFDKILRAGEGKILRKLQRIAAQVNSIEEDFVNLTDDELRALTDEYKAQRFASSVAETSDSKDTPAGESSSGSGERRTGLIGVAGLLVTGDRTRGESPVGVTRKGDTKGE